MEQYTVTINTTRTVEANSIPDAIAIATSKIPPQDITVKTVNTANNFLAKLKSKEDVVEEKRKAVIQEIVSGFAADIAKSEQAILHNCEYVMEHNGHKYILIEMSDENHTYDHKRPEFRLKFKDNYNTIHKWEHPSYDGNGGYFNDVQLETVKDEIIKQVLELMKSKLKELGLKVSYEDGHTNYRFTIETIRASW